MASEHALVISAQTGSGDRVRLARVAARLSRKQTARALEMSLRTFDRVEGGERELTLAEANRLATITGQEIGFFVDASIGGNGNATLPGPLPHVNQDGSEAA